MPNTRAAAVLTVGSELTEGLRVDTNSAEIARALAGVGFVVDEIVSVGDDITLAAESLRRLTRRYTLVVTTGGLGPTHDDITRQAASQALELPLVRDDDLAAGLTESVARQWGEEAARRVLVQADVLQGARVIAATTGTAPGLVVPTGTGTLALLPGPPSEMRPMLADLVSRFGGSRATPRDLGVFGLSESEAQIAAQAALESIDGIRLTVLARPGDVRVILLDEGAGDDGLEYAATRVAEELGENCYSVSGESLAETVVRAAIESGLTVGVAESCTGGLVAAALTDVPGASATFVGGVVAYDDAVKRDALGVDPRLLHEYGAVSSQVAIAMAEGVRHRVASDIAVSVTGIAGPDGGTPDKPVGLVWFGVAGPAGTESCARRFPQTSRASIRERSVATALDLLRGTIART